MNSSYIKWALSQLKVSDYYLAFIESEYIYFIYTVCWLLPPSLKFDPCYLCVWVVSRFCKNFLTRNYVRSSHWLHHTLVVKKISKHISFKFKITTNIDVRRSSFREDGFTALGEPRKCPTSPDFYRHHWLPLLLHLVENQFWRIRKWAQNWTEKPKWVKF